MTKQPVINVAQGLGGNAVIAQPFECDLARSSSVKPFLDSTFLKNNVGDDDKDFIARERERRETISFII